MKTETLQLDGIQYLKVYPKTYEEGKKHPVIIFLHGAGTRGTDIESVRTNPYFTITKTYEDFPFITIAPYCHEDTWYDKLEFLKKLVYKIAQSDFADSERIYLMGNSMGGYGTWQLAMSIPEMFAAIVPICGGGMYWNAPTLVNVPVWATHGGKDSVVYPEESQKMVDAVNHAGGNAKLTIYHDNHHDVWTDTYKNPEIFEWLLSHKNENITEIVDKYKDQKIYG